MGLQNWIRILLPREEHFYDFLERQAVVAHDGAKALARFRNGTTAQEVRGLVQEIEHDGDRLLHEMEEALAKTFVTPIDREDLQNLSSELDDILDFTNGAARACVLYGIEKPSEAMVKLMDELTRCTEQVRDALPKLRQHAYADLIQANRQLRKMEKEADQIYRDAISALFHDDSIDAKRLLREKGVLEAMENAIDMCERVGERLTNLAVKHG